MQELSNNPVVHISFIWFLCWSLASLQSEVGDWAMLRAGRGLPY